MSIDDWIYMAQIAETAERYEDMIVYLKPVLTTPKEGSSYVILDEKGKSLFSIAYKSITAAQRSSLRVLQMTLKKPEVVNNKDINDEVTHFFSSLQSELKANCDDVIQYCQKLLENPSLQTEDIVFYYKMVGDYYRYLAEFLEGAEKEDIARKASDSYQRAMDEGLKGQLSPCSSSILGLALNLSVFYYEILGDSVKVGSLGAFNHRLASWLRRRTTTHMTRFREVTT